MLKHLTDAPFKPCHASSSCARPEPSHAASASSCCSQPETGETKKFSLPELHLASTSVLLDHEHKGQQLVRGYNEAHNRLERGAYEASEAPHDRRSCLWPKPSTAA